VEQAERNERFYIHLRSQGAATERYSEWQVVGLFYSALHYIDAFMARRMNAHPPSHEVRINTIAMFRELDPVAGYFLHLYNRSREARYDLIKFSDTYVQQLNAQRYESLKRHIRGLLNLP
jgi:hypothetical protein